MRKRGLSAAEKLLLGLVLGVGLCALGITYAAWTANLNIRTYFGTGMFNMIFPDSEEGDYYVWLTDENGSPLENLETELIVSEDGKQADLTFGSGLPVELLAQGYYIKVVYPLKQAENNTINKVEPVNPDLDDTGEEVQMKAESGMLMVDGTPYGLEEILEPFMIPLKFYAYTGVEEDEGELRGYLYLKLMEESLSAIHDMPEAIELETEALEESMSDWAELVSLSENAENSVVITYSCELPLYLDQKGAYGMDHVEEGGG